MVIYYETIQLEWQFQAVLSTFQTLKTSTAAIRTLYIIKHNHSIFSFRGCHFYDHVWICQGVKNKKIILQLSCHKSIVYVWWLSGLWEVDKESNDCMIDLRNVLYVSVCYCMLEFLSFYADTVIRWNRKLLTSIQSGRQEKSWQLMFLETRKMKYVNIYRPEKCRYLMSQWTAAYSVSDEAV